MCTSYILIIYPQTFPFNTLPHTLPPAMINLSFYNRDLYDHIMTSRQ